MSPKGRDTDGPNGTSDVTQVHKFHHPGAGRRKARLQPKGRQADPSSLAEIEEILSGRPRRRDLLIEILHLVQDRYGCLAARHLAALAELMRLSMAEVYEVATFYAHFDVVVGDSEIGLPVEPKTTLRVCQSLSCAIAGSKDLMSTLETDLADRVRVVAAPCMGGCAAAPVVSIGSMQIGVANPKSITAALEDDSHGVVPELPAYLDFGAYRKAGGYELLKACRAGRHTRAQVVAALDAAGLRGMGGAFFPTARKWSLVAAEKGPRAVVINADEGEVGTFKDRHYMETDPHRMLEGMLIAAWAVDAEEIYIYLRDEYAQSREILTRELAALVAANLIGADSDAALPSVELRRGAGAYICGEESAMIESIEGKRGLPRHRPPYVAQVGVFGLPTLVNNVETVYWVREILDQRLGEDADRVGYKQSIRAYSVSGRVKSPGVKLAPIGITMNELLEDYCGGMAEGHSFKAYLPGGASGGILPAALADLPFEQDALLAHGCFVGSAAIVVLSDQDDMAQAALNLMRFFEHESCGQCTPCRVGTAKAVTLMEADIWDVALLRELSQVMRDASICGLGQAAPNPLDCVLSHFPQDVPQ